MSILLISSSPNLEGSNSRALAENLANGLVGDARVVVRDLGANPPPHLDQETIGAFYTPEADRTAEQKQKLALSDTLIDEVFAADAIVIAAPMHNFGIASSLKAWIDHVARIGRTFEPTGQGPKGLVTDRPVYVVTTRGGVYGPGTPFNHLDHLEPYLRRALNFIGIENISFIYAEGTAKGDDGIKAAQAEIAQVAQAA
ncbi:NAD(P)H-dependent oxidoreductase [Thalassospiraceae bacterium LMO-SO8]|nr:NAD(P)H-dependent oxidoreductase [Alphaproteobacteria bacterium LMO-S08]WND76586.1 NAD(P)H-dependent oxidoreductase [Thalassospiraceae bacterium LMO-SO8]